MTKDDEEETTTTTAAKRTEQPESMELGSRRAKEAGSSDGSSYLSDNRRAQDREEPLSFTAAPAASKVANNNNSGEIGTLEAIEKQHAIEVNEHSDIQQQETMERTRQGSAAPRPATGAIQQDEEQQAQQRPDYQGMNSSATSTNSCSPLNKQQQRAIKNKLHQQSDINQQQHSNQVPISADYLAQLIKDKKQLSAFPSVFIHVQRLIDDEIVKVRQSLFQLQDVVQGLNDLPLELPEPEGELCQLQEKIYVPIGEHPEYNFVGRLLGPRGMTAKQLEQETGCKIMIRGRGSMRDKKKEEMNRGKANWEHLNDDLHVLITVEDTQNRAKLKLKRALEEVKQLLVPIVDGEDELKKRQLMELAIINGTYRDCNCKCLLRLDQYLILNPSN